MYTSGHSEDQRYIKKKYKKLLPYKYSNKRKFLWKSQTDRKGQKSNNYVKKPSKKNCTCFICGDPKQLANAYPNKRNNRFNGHFNLVYNLEEDVLSISSNDSEAYNIISDYEILKFKDLENLNLEPNSKESTDSEDEDYIFMNKELDGLDLEQLDEKVECQHEFVHRQRSNTIRCQICRHFPNIELGYKCKNCKIEVCKLCLVKNYKNPPIELQKSKHILKSQNLEI